MSRPTPIALFPGPGCIVEFMQGNQPQTAWVLEESAGRLRLFTLAQRETKLPVGRLLPWSGPVLSGRFDRAAMLSELAARQNKRTDLAQSLDALELWSLAQGELQSAKAEWFAGLLFDSPDIDQIAAMGRSLIACKTHFKFHPPEFEVYPAEVVDKRLAEQAQAAERERVIGAGRDFFQALWANWASGRGKDPAALAKNLDPEVGERLKALLRAQIAAPDGGEEAVLWTTLRKGLPEHPHQALLLAEQWGVVPPHYNYLLDQAGYEAGPEWEEEYAADAAAMTARRQAAASPPEPVPFVSIDAASTVDIDDAFHVRKDGESFVLSLALACPALGFDPASALWRKVMDRASSLYLPEGVSHMLPRVLGTDLYSLMAGQPRPALVLDIGVSQSGQIEDVAPRLTWIEVTANLTYFAVEQALASGQADPNLVLGHELATVLRAARLARGAVITEREEPKITLTGYPYETEVVLNGSEQPPMAQLLVSEMMILGNAAAAWFAANNGLALLFRTQDVELGPGSSGVWSRPEDIAAVARQLAPPAMETTPRRHSGLGVAAYAPITSPLRRAVDLINAEQFRSLCQEGTPRYGRDDLERMIPELSARVEAVAQIQRFRPRYWKLFYLKRHCRERTFTGVAVDDGRPFLTLALPEVQINVRAARDMLGEKVRPGSRFALRLGKIDPLTNDIRVLDALPEDG